MLNRYFSLSANTLRLKPRFQPDLFGGEIEQN
jgi:hypothetical protein